MGESGIKKNFSGGTNHNVSSFGGLLFKECPESPGTEAMVSTLYHILVQHGAPFSKLATLKFSKLNETPVLVSLEVEGESLFDYINSVRPKELENLDDSDLSDMYIMSMICPRADGKPSNWILESGKDKRRFVSIDNDQDFLVNSFNSEKGIFSRIIKYSATSNNVLFCLPIVHKPLHSSTLKKFRRLNTKEMLKCWAQKITEIDKENLKLFQKTKVEELYEKYQKQDIVNGCVIPMTIHPKTITFLYNRLKMIKKMIINNPSITHLQILRGLDPILSKIYSKQLEKENSPFERFVYIQNNQFEKLSGDLLFKTSTNTKNTLENRLDVVPKSLDETHIGISLIKDQVISLFDRRERISKLKKELHKLDVKNPGNISELLRDEQVLSSVKFQKLSEEIKSFILDNMISSKISFSFLKLKSLEDYTERKLTKILKQSPFLVMLHLERMMFPHKNYMVKISKLCQRIYTLSLINLPRLSVFDDDIKLENLYQLNISCCPNLVSITIPPNVSNVKIIENYQLITCSFSQKGNESLICFIDNPKLKKITGLNFSVCVPQIKILDCPKFHFPLANSQDKNYLADFQFFLNSNQFFTDRLQSELKKEQGYSSHLIGLDGKQISNLKASLDKVLVCGRCDSFYFLSINSGTSCCFHPFQPNKPKDFCCPCKNKKGCQYASHTEKRNK